VESGEWLSWRFTLIINAAFCALALNSSDRTTVAGTPAIARK